MQWRVKDFPDGGDQNFPEKCMKTNKMGPEGWRTSPRYGFKPGNMRQSQNARYRSVICGRFVMKNILLYFANAHLRNNEIRFIL